MKLLFQSTLAQLALSYHKCNGIYAQYNKENVKMCGLAPGRGGEA